MADHMILYYIISFTYLYKNWMLYKIILCKKNYQKIKIKFYVLTD